MQPVKQQTDGIRLRAIKRALQEEVLRRITLVEDKPVQQAIQTDPAIPATVTPQGDQIVHIASTIPALLGVSHHASQIVLDGYRMAFLRRRWLVNGVTYIIDDVFFSPEPRHIGKIYARLRKLGKMEEKTSGQH